MQNAGLDEAQVEIKISERNTNNLRYTDDTTLMAESEEELNSLLMKVKEKSENFGLNTTFRKLDHGIWSHHFMGNRWGNNGNSVRFCFFVGGSRSLLMVIVAMKLTCTYSLEEKL